MNKEPTWDRPPPPPKSAASPAACCAGAGGTGGSGTGRSGMTPVPITPADGVDSAQKHTGSVSSAGNGGDCDHSATSPTCAAAAAAFDPDAVERHKFTSIYEVSGKREHTHIMECVDAADYDKLHLLYDESEAARVRQMRTIEELTEELNQADQVCRNLVLANKDEIARHGLSKCSEHGSRRYDEAVEGAKILSAEITRLRTAMEAVSNQFDDLTRERDALAAECKAWREYHYAILDNKPDYDHHDHYEEAMEATNALPGMREMLEGQ